MSVKTVAIVDNHPLIVEGLSLLFKDRADYQLLATGRSLMNALDIAERLAPDILILEPAMEGRGYDCISQISAFPKTSVVAFTSLPGVEPAVRALDAGAKGYTLKSNSADELHLAISAIGGGDTYITPAFATKVIMALRNSSLRKRAVEAIKLSVREEKIIQMLLQGRTNKEIGIQLAISEKTVKHHMTILMQKMHARNRVEVLIAAQKLGSETLLGFALHTDNVH